MATDRELLERAARAAGYEFTHWNESTYAFWEDESDSWWNSLTSNSDAFRLMVDLGLHFDLDTWYDFLDLSNQDAIAATRRAITLSAAELAEYE